VFVCRIRVEFMAPISKSILFGVEMLSFSPDHVYHSIVAVPLAGDHRSEVIHTSKAPVVRLWKGVMMTFL